MKNKSNCDRTFSIKQRQSSYFNRKFSKVNEELFERLIAGDAFEDASDEELMTLMKAISTKSVSKLERNVYQVRVGGYRWLVTFLSSEDDSALISRYHSNSPGYIGGDKSVYVHRHGYGNDIEDVIKIFR
jgi:hypothetical protein